MGNTYWLEDYIVHQFPSLPYIISDGVLPSESKCILFGPGKIGKTIMMQELASNVILGNQWYTFKTTQSVVLSINFEVADRGWQVRWQKYFKAANLVIPPHRCALHTELRGYKLDTPQGQAEVERLVQQIRPNVMIVDPITKVISTEVNDDMAVSKALDFLDMLIDKYKISIILIGHTRKNKMSAQGSIVDLGAQELRGSYLFVQWVDSLIYVYEPFKDRVKMEFLCRHAEKDLNPINLQLDRTGLKFEVKP